jgi:hypothetical protein
MMAGPNLHEIFRWLLGRAGGPGLSGRNLNPIRDLTEESGETHADFRENHSRKKPEKSGLTFRDLRIPRRFSGDIAGNDRYFRLVGLFLWIQREWLKKFRILDRRIGSAFGKKAPLDQYQHLAVRISFM